MRKLGNIPRLLHFLTVLMWMFNKLAASPAVSKVFVSSASPSEILFSEYSVARPSIPDYPFFVDKILPLDTIHDSSYRTVNLTSQKLTKYNSYVTNAYNRQMKVDICRLHEKTINNWKVGNAGYMFRRSGIPGSSQ